MRTVTALYSDFEMARQVVEELAAAGFARDQISVAASGVDSLRQTTEDEVVATADAEDVSAGKGAGFGAVVGALVGLGVVIVPGIGPVLAAGPLAALIGAGVGAVTGAVTGGLVAGLVHMGIPEDEVDTLAEGVRRGGALVVARVAEERTHEAVNIMREHNPLDLDRQAQHWRQAG